MEWEESSSVEIGKRQQIILQVNRVGTYAQIASLDNSMKAAVTDSDQLRYCESTNNIGMRVAGGTLSQAIPSCTWRKTHYNWLVTCALAPDQTIPLTSHTCRVCFRLGWADAIVFGGFLCWRKGGLERKKISKHLQVWQHKGARGAVTALVSALWQKSSLLGTAYYQSRVEWRSKSTVIVRLFINTVFDITDYNLRPYTIHQLLHRCMTQVLSN